MTTSSPPSTTTCPSCGTSSPVGHRFCMSCGSDLTGQAPDRPLSVAAAPPQHTSVLSGAGLTPLVKAQRFSPAMFGAILLCFLLPFITVSCRNFPSEVTFSGVDLIVGKVVDGQPFDALPSVRWAFFAALVGLGANFIRPAASSNLWVNFFRPVAGAGLATFAGLLGIGAMLYTRIGLNQATLAYARQIVVNYNLGYELVIGLFLIALVVNAAVVIRHLRAP